MNKKEAQFILESYRPGTEDDSDPLFREALALAKNDPELLLWLEKNDAMDKEVRRALEGITPPETLKQAILSATQAALETHHKQETSSTTHAHWWQSPWTLSMAASIALTLLIAVSIIDPREAEADWTVSRIFDSASAQLNEPLLPESERVSLGTLKERLNSGDLPHPSTRAEATQGYTLLNWDGLSVERWTFSSETGAIYNLYVIDSESLNPEPSISTPLFKQMQETAFAAWTANGALYVLAHRGTIEALKPMVERVGKTPTKPADK
jgi:hypothetical protein